MKLSLLTLIAVLLWAPTSGCRLLPHLRNPLFPSTPTPTPIPVRITLLEGDDSNLPEALRAAFLEEGPPTRLEEAAGAPADAVLISHHALFTQANDPELRPAFVRILQAGKVLLVYDASTVDLVRQLEIHIPTVTTQTTHYAVVGVARNSEVNVSGGLLKANSEDGSEVTAEDIRDYLRLFLAQVKRSPSYP